MHHHSLSSGTHTVELAQLAELRRALHAPGAPRITAVDLGLGQATAGSSPKVPPGAVLTDLSYEGPPKYPYIHARFVVGPGFAGESGRPAAWFTVEMHTPALVALSHRLHLRHVWGA